MTTSDSHPGYAASGLVGRRSAWTRFRHSHVVPALLVAADLAGLSIAFFSADLVYGGESAPRGTFGPTTEAWLFLLTLPGWVCFARLYGLYSRDTEWVDHSTSDDVPAILNLVTLGVWAFYGLARFSRLAHPDVTKLFVFWALAIVLVPSLRALARATWRQGSGYAQNTVIVGAGDVGQLVGRKLRNHPEYGINLVGFVDEDPRERRPDLEGCRMLGTPERLLEIVGGLDIQRVIVAFSRDPHSRTLELVRSLTDHDVQVDIVPRLFEVVTPDAPVHAVEGVPLVSLTPPRLSPWARFLKRALDLVGAGILLLLAGPLFLVVAHLIRRDTGEPVYFRQLRIGADGKPFRIWKFRTMTVDADDRKCDVAHLNKHLLPGGDPRMFKICGDPRVTRVGAFLRRYSLDELPQLFNVLRGEMSLVGPRPLIPDEHRFVDGWAETRVRLRPGMTGLWQVLGRSEIPFDEMVKLDYLYVTNWSVWNDCRILFRTFAAVLHPGAAA
jgi:exopolysaccharide biosynthesis polyprenyl glycosylphosphotransferase